MKRVILTTLSLLFLATIMILAGCSNPSSTEASIGRVSPIMTGNSTNSEGTYTNASVSVTLGHGEYDSDNNVPWKVFDGNDGTMIELTGVSGYTEHNPNFDVTLLIDFGQDSNLPVVTGFYVLGSDDRTDRGPADMILYGSNDNSNWDELKEIEDSEGAKVYDCSLDETVTYRYYKLHITDNAHTDRTNITDKTYYDYGIMIIKEFYMKGIQ